MSRFSIHEWNYKRRLAEIEDRLFTGQSPERQEQALDDLANAIEELEMSGVFDDGNKMVEFMLNKAYNMLSKKLNVDSDLNEIEEQQGAKVYVVIVGRPGEPQGPTKAFMNKVSAEKHAVETKQEYEDRFGGRLNAFVREIPIE